MAQSQTLIEEYLDILKITMPLDVMVLGYITLARIRFAEKKHGEALALLRKVEEVASQHNLSRLVVTVGQERVRLALRRDDLVGAQRWYSEMKDRAIWKDLAGRTMSANDPETPEVFDLRLMVKLGNASEALKPLTTALSRAESTGRRWQALVLQIIQAQALDACGDRNAALEALGEALSFAVPQGFVRTFADEGAPVARLLRGLRKTAMAGEIEITLDWLEKAYDERVPLLVLTAAEPDWDVLRGQPRFQELLRKLGLPE